MLVEIIVGKFPGIYFLGNVHNEFIFSGNFPRILGIFAINFIIVRHAIKHDKNMKKIYIYLVVLYKNKCCAAK